MKARLKQSKRWILIVVIGGRHPSSAVKHIDLVQKKELFAYGGLADNAARSRSSSDPKTLAFSRAVEFG